jgi:hypothetical protein
MNRKLLLLALVLLVAGVFSACAGPAYISVRTAPPPPQTRGIAGFAPGPGYVWVDGFWDWRGGNWYWVRGYWVRPPRPRAIWVAPRWEPYGRGYRFHRGYWR